METTKTLFRIDFYNKRTCDIQTKYTLADHFSEAYHVAMLLMYNHREFDKIRQITELYSTTIVTPEADNEHTDK